MKALFFGGHAHGEEHRIWEPPPRIRMLKKPETIGFFHWDNVPECVKCSYTEYVLMSRSKYVATYFSDYGGIIP